ncbi:MAG: tetratricopeptide repeat protein [Muribaculaceae bacterium]|nr:tetratricopeptide repeat protein [Muribaculaceae bacterium]
MEIKEIHEANRNIHRLLDNARVNEAFSALDPLIQTNNDWAMREQIEQLRISYQFMLKYMQQGIDDPKRNDVYNDIVNKLYTITDGVTLSLLEPVSNEIIATRRRELKDTTLSSIVEKQKSEINKFSLLTSVPETQHDAQAIATVIKQREIHETAIFNKVWSSFPMNADDATLITSLIADEDYPTHSKCLITSALFLGMMCYYDERKLQLLMDIYTSATSVQVQLRALISVLLAVKVHQERVVKSVALVPHTKAMIDEPHFTDDMAIIQFQLARSRNTENISRRVKEELMPDIMKLNPNILKIRDDITEIADLEANPEWQEMLENSGIAKKMEELNELQLEGSDVFISTFSRLKTFPFFQTLSNWFLPFHENCSAIHGEFAGDEAPLLMVVTKAPFLCNSDRYSFALSLSSMPFSQRQLLLNQVKAQVEQVGEMQKTELPDDKQERERQANMYVQDLYRFFKLFSRRREFMAAFDCDMDFTQLPLIGDAAISSSTITLVAEFYLKNEFYNDALKYYGYLLDNTQDANPLIYQKMGFCYQSLRKTDDAIEYYRRYELADDNNLWTLRHLAACYRENKEYDKAIEYYKKIEAAKPDNVANIINMGHCRLEQGDIEEAMKIYFKADLMDESNHRARRPVAWCSFLLGNDERSLAYYDRIIDDDKPTAQDYLNRGHVLLAMKKSPEAIDSYRQALKLMNGNVNELRKAMLNDGEALQSRGIAIADLPLLIDAITL